MDGSGELVTHMAQVVGLTADVGGGSKVDCPPDSLERLQDWLIATDSTNVK